MLSKEERAAKIKEVQNRTIEDMMIQLKKYGMVNVDRPCGLGKTTIFTRWASKQDFKSLYFYETDDIKKNVRKYSDSEHIQLMSYSMLFRMKCEDFINTLRENKIGALIFDESHKVGAKTIKEKWDPMVAYCKKNHIYLIGGTGTPVRTDAVDVTEDMFEGHSVYTYGINEAFDDQLLTEPWYIAADVTDMDLSTLSDDEKRMVYEADNPEDIISDALKFTGIKRDYMKFIIYYPTIKDVEEGCDYWRKCFHNLYPNHEINTLAITSSPKHKVDVKTAGEYNERPNAIDLFVCVDMMNQGVHPEDLTGIIMCRKTDSILVYTQQCGRCMSVWNTNDMVVIDMVGNISRQFQMKNPLAEYMARSYPENVEKGGWSKRDIKRVHMSAKQMSKMNLRNKLMTAESLKNKQVQWAVKIYSYRPEHNLIGMCKKFKLDLGTVLMTAYYHGKLRDEDKVPEIDIESSKPFNVRLAEKYEAEHAS